MSDLLAYPVDESVPVIVPEFPLGSGPRQSTSSLIFRYSGRLFAVVANANLDTIYVYTSTAGKTWTQCHAAGRPSDGLATLWHAIAEGQYLRIVYVYDARPAFDLRIKSFDMSAQLWVAGELAGGPAEVTDSGRFELKQTIQLGAGEYFVFYALYDSPTATDHRLFFAHYTSGSWTVDQTLDGTTGTLSVDYEHGSCVFDGAFIHCAYYIEDTLCHLSVEYGTWTVSAPATIAANCRALWDLTIFGGEMWLPVLYRYNIAGFPNRARPAVWRATTGGATPSWTMDDHCPEQVDQYGWNGQHKLLASGGTLYSIWEPSNINPFDSQLIEYRTNTGSGWSVSRTTLIEFTESPFAAPYSTADGLGENTASPFFPIADSNAHGISLLVYVQVEKSVPATSFAAACYLAADSDCCCEDEAY